MNNPYQTPCSPMKCDRYVYGELCGNESKCDKYINYQVLKQLIKADRKQDRLWREQHTARVDSAYKHQKSQTRVGQK